MPEVKIGEFKGSATISLPLDEEGKYTFTFGKNKAKAILTYIEDIRKFVEDGDEDE